MSIELNRPTLRQQHQAVTREKLLWASYETFSSRGFYDTTVKQIVDHAGTSRATFYLHFQSKSEALAAAWREIQLEKMEPLWQYVDQLSPWSSESIHAWMDRMIAAWEAAPQFALSSNQALTLDPIMAKEWFDGMSEFCSLVPNLLATIDPDIDKAKMRFILLCTQMERTAYMWLSGNFPGTRSELLHSLSYFWITMIESGQSRS
ncbi:TetR/AcrR family transcriptional regulator [Paraglaciecola chathamensis]|uniref:HTH tetR-type domain-containing protein n=1 Tax=Paraglaciecola agarilytica NO2 TaxID=1125747 RepID=A0ABQ0IAN4_9ALTE|nr:TetR/AcrR family transcriptional regulator [Paraglaciecola agarilytica]GAC06440.1 hypothetical protein GAGA_3607 [Paraglaciecola agarilytica NO2]